MLRSLTMRARGNLIRSSQRHKAVRCQCNTSTTPAPASSSATLHVSPEVSTTSTPSSSNSTASPNSIKTSTHSSSPLAAAAVSTAHPLHELLPISEQCAEIRRRFCKEWLSGGLVYVEGGDLLIRNGGDVNYRFRAASHFVYLTGVTEPGFACLIDTETGHFTLIAPKQSDDMMFWVGALPSLEELAQTYGADRCCYNTELASLVQAAKSRAIHTLPGQGKALTAAGGGSSGSSSSSSSSSASSSTSTLKVMDGEDGLDSCLKRCRSLKTAAEIGCQLMANQISGIAHMDMWRASRPGIREYQLESVFMQSAMARGAHSMGYPAIVGAGVNAAILHYGTNNDVAKSGDMVLVDAGIEFRCYTADISRTFPVNGVYSGAQRDMYEAVLNAQELAVTKMVPGAVMAEVDAAGRRVLLQRLQQMGLVSKGASMDALMDARIDRVFMPHGIGHHLGLDVHDCSAQGPVPKKLVEGNVVTCEPGLYFIKPLLDKAAADRRQASLINIDAARKLVPLGGVRIEDDILVTKKTPFNITMEAGVPKAMAEIEEIMKQQYEPMFM